MRPGLTSDTRIHTIENGTLAEAFDALAAEEPLEIRIAAGGSVESIGVTMRTPGNDFELAAGFLFAEGIVRERREISEIVYCFDERLEQEQIYNIVTVRLAAQGLPPIETPARRFAITSSCGICGRATIEALRDRVGPLEDDTRVSSSTIAAMPDRMREAQRIFERTGGLHAAAVFDRAGGIVALREDVGRHNALDKVVGWALLNERIPLRGHVLMVSGRASYELVQKSVIAGIPVLCAVSAPSSLAVGLAREFDLTLAGFVRGGRFNIYSGRERILV